MDSILLIEADPLVSITAIAYFAAPTVWPILLLCRQQFCQDLFCADSSFVQTSFVVPVTCTHLQLPKLHKFQLFV